MPGWFERAVVDGGGEIVDIADAEALMWHLGDPGQLAEQLRLGTQLRWVQLPSAGIEAYREHVDERIAWTCAKGVYGEPVAEHALALGLAGLRGLATYSRERAWTNTGGRNLVDKSVVILGGGGIAESLIRFLVPFRASVTVVRRHVRPMEDVVAVVPTRALRDVLPAADLVVIALALTPETTSIIAEPELRTMSSDSWLVNVGRGAHVVTDDLTRALREHWIGGAALDVTDPEPLPSDHELWTSDRCIITPHTANSLEMYPPLLAGLIADNLRRFASGLPLRSQIDPGLGY